MTLTRAETRERRAGSVFAEAPARWSDAAGWADHFEQATLPLLPSLYSVAQVLTDDDTEAEDLVVEAYTRAHRTFGASGSRPVKVWMLGILVGAAGSRDSRPFPRSIVSLEGRRGAAGGHAGSHLLGMNGTVMTVALEAASCADVEAALASVPTGFRLVLWLVDGEDLTYADIASILDVSVETVGSAVRLARSVFGEQLLLGAGPLRRDGWSRQARP